jgi:biotin transport system substrate-specific component
MSVSSEALSRPIVLADLVPGTRLRNLALTIGGAGFVGVAAQISVPLPNTPVPVTGQTFAVLLTGAALGSRRSLASMALYLLAGVAGVPWFAGHQSGWGGPAFGYIIGFLLAAVVVGRLAAAGGDRTPARTVITMLVGTVLIYAIGVPWLMAYAHMTISSALSAGVRPFVAGDVLKVLLAAGLLPAAWWGVGRVRGRQDN